MGNFAFLRGTREGFVRDLNHPDHSLGSEDTWAGRGQLRIILGTQSELLLSGDYGRFSGVPLTYAKPIAAKPNFTQPFEKLTSLWTVKTSDLTSGQNIQQGASAKLAVRLNGTTTLTSLTAYRRSNYRFFIDADATELRLQTSDVPNVQRQVSQELTLVQRTPKLTWIGGGFFYDEHYEGPVEITVYTRWVSDPALCEGRCQGGGAVRPGDVHPDTPTVADGWRTVYRRAEGSPQYGREVPARDWRALICRYDYVDNATYDAWTPKGSIQLQVSRDAFVYASATQGFKSGGFNQFNPTAPEPERAFSPEFAWSFEGGLKRTMAGGRVRVNTAVFFNDYQDLQVQSFLGDGLDSTSATPDQRRSEG